MFCIYYHTKNKKVLIWTLFLVYLKSCENKNTPKTKYYLRLIIELLPKNKTTKRILNYAWHYYFVHECQSDDDIFLFLIESHVLLMDPFSYIRRVVIVTVVCCIIWISSCLWTDVQAASFPIGYAKFAQWTCTEYVASRRQDLFPSRHGHDRLFGGNAIDWLTNAQRAGVPTGIKPQSEAIAVFRWWRWASSSYGHVAIVEEIYDNGTILVSDMNYAWRNVITHRIISSSLAVWYIYRLPTPDIDEPPVHYIVPTLLSSPEEIVWWHISLHDDYTVTLAPIMYATIPSSPDEPSDIDISLIIADRRNRISYDTLLRIS